MHLLSFLLASTLLISTGTPQSIDPSTVPVATRENWCNLQTSTCPLLCPQIGGSLVPLSNTCNATTLAYACLCSNNLSPNTSQYSQTIPYFECSTLASQCAANCTNGDSACVSTCRTAHPCGAQDPPKGNHTSSASATAAPTSSGGAGIMAQATGFGGPNNSGAHHDAAVSWSVVVLIMGMGVAMGGI